MVFPGKENRIYAHRLIKQLEAGEGITKGDAMLSADSEPIKLNGTADRVEAIIRNRRIISLATRPRLRPKGCYAWLSRHRLTLGSIRQRINRILCVLCGKKTAKKIPYHKPFLLSVLYGQKQDRIVAGEWTCLIQKFHDEGMAGLAYRRLKENNNIPPNVIKVLSNYYHSFVAQNLNNIEAIKMLEDALSGEMIEVMALKGISVLNRFYSGAGSRPMEDIDLMVRSEDRDRLVVLLKILGYRQNDSMSNSFVLGRTRLDLHCHALNTDRISSREQLFPSGMEPIWAKSIPLDFNYRWVRRPGDIDNVLLLSQHLMKHYFSRLIWLEDIYRIIKHCDAEFWRLLIERAKELEQIKPLSYALYLLTKYYQFLPPQSQETAKMVPKPFTHETFLLDLSTSEQALELLAPVMAAFTIHGFSRRFRFVMENLFPQKKVLVSEFGYTSRENRWIFIPLRLGQAMVMLLRHCRAALRLHSINQKPSIKIPPPGR
jgi:hypothetical protein